MFEFHSDRNRYFNMQRDNSLKYILPFIEKIHPLKEGANVLEIGCGEGGVLVPFLERGCFCVGVEFDLIRLEMPGIILEDFIKNNKLKLIGKDIYDIDPYEEFGVKFDVIILKDVIEHIHNQPKLINEMKRFLSPNGVIFFGFPPWQMPFGGHQQICKNKVLSKLPYYHLLPKFLYKSLLTFFKEPVEGLLEIKETAITIERFEKIVHDTGYNICSKVHYLINPIYEYKFNLKPREQFKFIQYIPWVRNFFTTCVYYLITPNSNTEK